MSLAYGIGGFVKVAPGALRGNGPPPASFKGELGQQFFDESTSPPTQYIYNGATWETGGNAYATTTTPGIVELATAAEMSAGTSTTLVPPVKEVFDYVNSVAIAGAPDATTVTKGIVYLATNSDVVSPYTPANPNTCVEPGNITTMFASPPAIGGTAAEAATFTDLTADGTGTVSLGANAASDFTITGAFDLTLASTAGSLVVNAGEAAADAIDLNAAAGGLDVDVALLASITSTRNNAQAILLESTAGGIDILASGSGGAGEDIDIVCTGGSVNISGTENAADAVTIAAANGGIDITCGGAAGEDIDITNTAGSVIISGGEAVANAISLQAAAGGIDVDGAGQINIASSQNAADSIVIESSAGGIDILASGATAGEDIDIIATGSSVNITSTEDVAQAIYLRANAGTSETIQLHADQGTSATSLNLVSDVGGITLTAGLASADAINFVATNGGIDFDAGTSGFIFDTTGAISLDAGAASNFTVTGAFDLTLSSTAGSVIMTGAEAAADAIDINASDAAGGIDIDCGTGGIAIDSTGAFSIDGATASNITVTGATEDLTLSSVGGSVLVSSTEDAALAIRLHANGGTSETIQIHSDQGTSASSIDILSDVGGITLTATGLASADAINLVATAGGIDMDSALQTNITSSQNAADAIRILASAGGIDIDATGAAGEDIVITNTGGSVNVVATEAIADSIVLSSSNGGIDILAPGAGAGLDIDITNTGGSVNITATEATADAIVLNASNAAGGIDISTGGGSVDISSSGFFTVAPATDTQASPTAASTLNVNVGAVTFTGFTTMPASTEDFTITNSLVTTSSAILCTVCNEGANDAQMTITRITRSAGAFVVRTTNNGAAALNGNVIVTFWVLS